MKKQFLKYIALLTGLLLMMMSAVALAANDEASAEPVVSVDDRANLLSADEIAEVTAGAKALSDKTLWDVLVVSTDDAGGRTAQKYADHYYLEHAGQNNGVTVLIDMDNRTYYISTSGMAIRYLTDSRIDSILDDAYDDMRSGNYDQAYITMLRRIGSYYDKGIPGGQVNVDEETGQRDYYEEEDSLGFLFMIFAGIALVTFAVMFLSVKGRYQMKTGKYHYIWQQNMAKRITRRLGSV